MRKVLHIIFLLLISLHLFAVNGSIEFNEDQEILNLWGDNYSMGYAQGWLLNERIPELFCDYLFIGIGISPFEYNLMYLCYWSYFTVPVEYLTEARGILDGMIDYGTDIYIDLLGRDLDTLDLMIMNSLGDISYILTTKNPFNCSSLSSWGDATNTDTLLNGNIIMGRNLDFIYTQLMLNSALIIAIEPDSGKNWVTFAYPGIFSCISGMNEDMLVVEMNMGFHNSTINFTDKFEPYQFTQREVLELSDYNEDSLINYMDVFDKSKDSPNAGSWLCHTIYPYIDSATISAAVIECVNESGDTFRIAENDTNFAPWNLLLLNHEEVNYTPINDLRYNIVLDSIESNSAITTKRMLNIMRAVSHSGTIQTMLFLPNDSMFAISFADSFYNSAEKTPEWYKWSDIFPNHEQGIAEDDSQEHFGKILSLTNLMEISKREEIEVYDVMGRRLDRSNIQKISSGVYFMILDKRVYKLMVIKR
ncbi:hypothetical protein KAX35_09150 [candidate division WOR-3 bacterium]|nr:hypothetical protein [candidate division WOR-3 bacterium]